MYRITILPTNSACISVTSIVVVNRSCRLVAYPPRRAAEEPLQPGDAEMQSARQRTVRLPRAGKRSSSLESPPREKRRCAAEITNVCRRTNHAALDQFSYTREQEWSLRSRDSSSQNHRYGESHVSWPKFFHRGLLRRVSEITATTGSRSHADRSIARCDAAIR